MTMHVRKGGVIKTATPHAKKGGVWKPVQQGWVKKAGVWKQFFSAAPAVTFNPVPGSYFQDNGGIGGGSVVFTITASAAVVWTWSATGSTGAYTSNRTQGASATSITFTLNPATTSATRNVVITVNANGQTWTLNLTAYGNGGGGVGGATMTL